MMKSMCVLARRADFSREQFQAYYEDHHAPLGVQHFPFAGYVRNHLLDAPEIGFDTISEFWAEDISALGALMQGPVGEILGKMNAALWINQKLPRPVRQSKCCRQVLSMASAMRC